MTFLSDGDELLDFKHVSGSEISCIAGFKLASVWMIQKQKVALLRNVSSQGGNVNSNLGSQGES